LAKIIMSVVKVVVLGCGTVGSAVLKRLQAAAIHHSLNYGVTFQLVAAADSSGAVFWQESAPLLYDDVLRWKEQKKPFASHVLGMSRESHKMHGKLMDLARGDTILVDCTATDLVTPLLKAALSSGAGVVFANKKVLTGPQDTFDYMTSKENRGRCKFESSVGAGTPFIACTQRVVAAGDHIKSIQGTFSGTLGFITSGLDEGHKLSDLVKEAYDKGYTEPDPRDDLSGMDVARKALILARISGWRFEMSQVQVEALFPANLSQVSVPDFLKGIKSYDETIAQRQKQAKAQGQVMRYIASVSADGCKVGLQSVAQDTPIGRLRGTNNILNLTSDIYSTTPLVVQGAGAGPDITAAGVVADMVDIATKGLELSLK